MRARSSPQAAAIRTSIVTAASKRFQDVTSSSIRSWVIAESGSIPWDKRPGRGGVQSQLAIGALKAIGIRVAPAEHRLRQASSAMPHP